MALILADGFDLYRTGEAVDIYTVGPFSGTRGGYGSVPYGPNATTTRFGVGKSMQFGTYVYGNAFFKSGFQSNNTIYSSFAVYPAGNANIDIRLSESGVVQVLFGISPSSGAMYFNRGESTNIANFTNAGVVANKWTHVQVKIVLSPTNGQISVRINGDAQDTFSVTGLNTMSTANAWVDSWDAYSATPGGYIDDLLIYDSSGTSFNTWTGDVRCYTMAPNGAGSSSDFSQVNAISQLTYNSTSNQPYAYANELHHTPFTPPINMSLEKFTVPLPSNFTGSINMALYADNTTSPGTPGALVATCTALTNPTAGNIDFVFPSPPSLTANTKYWASINTNAGLYLYGNASGGYYQARSYSSGFPANASNNGTSTALSFIAVSTAPLPNFLTLLTYDLDATYTQSATLSANDLCTMADLSTTPTYILAAIPRVLGRKTDAGVRSLQTQLLSGTTLSLGTSTVLSSNYSNITALYATDPNTNMLWTRAGINALQVGYKISA